jgi:hypothetical protein
MIMMRFLPQVSLSRPQRGDARKTAREEAPIMLVICISESPISRPIGASNGNSTENPIPTITRLVSRTLLALA